VAPLTGSGCAESAGVWRPVHAGIGGLPRERSFAVASAVTNAAARTLAPSSGGEKRRLFCAESRRTG